MYYSIGWVLIDALKEEKPSYGSEITSHAVEDGADVTDNIKVKPASISATCVIAGEQAQEKYESLKFMMQNPQLVTYRGSLEPVLYNMAIESMSPMRDVTFGDGFEFEITLIRVECATLQTFELPTTQEQAQKQIEQSVKHMGKLQTQKQTVDYASLGYSKLKSQMIV